MQDAFYQDLSSQVGTTCFAFFLCRAFASSATFQLGDAGTNACPRQTVSVALGQHLGVRVAGLVPEASLPSIDSVRFKSQRPPKHRLSLLYVSSKEKSSRTCLLYQRFTPNLSVFKLRLTLGLDTLITVTTVLIFLQSYFHN